MWEFGGVFLCLIVVMCAGIDFSAQKGFSGIYPIDIEGFTAIDIISEDGFGTSVAILDPADPPQGFNITWVIVGSPSSDGNVEIGDQLNSGAMYLVGVGLDGRVLDAKYYGAKEGYFGLVLNSNERFGSSVSGIGDVDGDECLDVVVGASHSSAQQGAVYLVFLNCDLSVKTHTRIDQLGGGELGSQNFFGGAITTIPDVDGDGIRELVVGAHGKDSERGSVFILTIDSSGSLKEFFEISPPISILDNLNVGAFPTLRFGYAVATLSMSSGIKLCIGAPFANDRVGATIIISLNEFSDWQTSVIESSTVLNSTGLPHTTMRSRFGSSLINVGDMNGDGVADLGVGAPRYDDPSARASGAFYVFHLSENGDVGKSYFYSKTSQILNSFAVGLDEGDNMGTSMGFVHDIDGDGVQDIILGMPEDSLAGAVFVWLWGGEFVSDSASRTSSVSVSPSHSPSMTPSPTSSKLIEGNLIGLGWASGELDVDEEYAEIFRSGPTSIRSNRTQTGTVANLTSPWFTVSMERLYDISFWAYLPPAEALLQHCFHFSVVSDSSEKLLSECINVTSAISRFAYFEFTDTSFPGSANASLLFSILGTEILLDDVSIIEGPVECPFCIDYLHECRNRSCLECTVDTFNCLISSDCELEITENIAYCYDRNITVTGSVVDTDDGVCQDSSFNITLPEQTYSCAQIDISHCFLRPIGEIACRATCGTCSREVPCVNIPIEVRVNQKRIDGCTDLFNEGLCANTDAALFCAETCSGCATQEIGLLSAQMEATGNISDFCASRVDIFTQALTAEVSDIACLPYTCSDVGDPVEFVLVCHVRSTRQFGQVVFDFNEFVNNWDLADFEVEIIGFPIDLGFRPSASASVSMSPSPSVILPSPSATLSGSFSQTLSVSGSHSASIAPSNSASPTPSISRPLSTNTRLDSLEINLELNPPFSSLVFVYEATVPTGQDSLSLTPTLENGNAHIFLDGSPVTNSKEATVDLAPGINHFEILIQAENRNIENPYAITVTRLFKPSVSPTSMTVTEDFDLDRDGVTLYVDFERPDNEDIGTFKAVVGYRLYLGSDAFPRSALIDSISLATYDEFTSADKGAQKVGLGIDGILHLFEVFQFPLVDHTHAEVVAFNSQGEADRGLVLKFRDRAVPVVVPTNITQTEDLDRRKGYLSAVFHFDRPEDETDPTERLGRNESIGAVLGYTIFSFSTRRQLTTEITSLNVLELDFATDENGTDTTTTVANGFLFERFFIDDADKVFIFAFGEDGLASDGAEVVLDDYYASTTLLNLINFLAIIHICLAVIVEYKKDILPVEPLPSEAIDGPAATRVSSRVVIRGCPESEWSDLLSSVISHTFATITGTKAKDVIVTAYGNTDPPKSLSKVPEITFDKVRATFLACFRGDLSARPLRSLEDLGFRLMDLVQDSTILDLFDMVMNRLQSDISLHHGDSITPQLLDLALQQHQDQIIYFCSAFNTSRKRYIEVYFSVSYDFMSFELRRGVHRFLDLKFHTREVGRVWSEKLRHGMIKQPLEIVSLEADDCIGYRLHYTSRILVRFERIAKPETDTPYTLTYEARQAILVGLSTSSGIEPELFTLLEAIPREESVKAALEADKPDVPDTARTETTEVYTEDIVLIEIDFRFYVDIARGAAFSREDVNEAIEESFLSPKTVISMNQELFVAVQKISIASLSGAAGKTEDVTLEQKEGEKLEEIELEKLQDQFPETAEDPNEAANYGYGFLSFWLVFYHYQGIAITSQLALPELPVNFRTAAQGLSWLTFFSQTLASGFGLEGSLGHVPESDRARVYYMTFGAGTEEFAGAVYLLIFLFCGAIGMVCISQLVFISRRGNTPQRTRALWKFQGCYVALLIAAFYGINVASLVAIEFGSAEAVSLRYFALLIMIALVVLFIGKSLQVLYRHKIAFNSGNYQLWETVDLLSTRWFPYFMSVRSGQEWFYILFMWRQLIQAYSLVTMGSEVLQIVAFMFIDLITVTIARNFGIFRGGVKSACLVFIQISSLSRVIFVYGNAMVLRVIGGNAILAGYLMIFVETIVALIGFAFTCTEAYRISNKYTADKKDQAQTKTSLDEMDSVLDLVLVGLQMFLNEIVMPCFSYADEKLRSQGKNLENEDKEDAMTELDQMEFQTSQGETLVNMTVAVAPADPSHHGSEESRLTHDMTSTSSVEYPAIIHSARSGPLVDEGSSMSSFRSSQSSSQLNTSRLLNLTPRQDSDMESSSSGSQLLTARILAAHSGRRGERSAFQTYPTQTQSTPLIANALTHSEIDTESVLHSLNMDPPGPVLSLDLQSLVQRKPQQGDLLASSSSESEESDTDLHVTSRDHMPDSTGLEDLESAEQLMEQGMETPLEQDCEALELTFGEPDSYEEELELTVYEPAVTDPNTPSSTPRRRREPHESSGTTLQPFQNVEDAGSIKQVWEIHKR